MLNDKEKCLQNIEHIKPKKLIGIRHLQFVLLFMTLIMAFGQRTTMSVAIIAMTEDNPPDPSIPTYPDWDLRDAILSSFFWGYIVPHIGAGQLSEYFGAKWFLVATITTGSLFSILVPVMAENFGQIGVMICRIVQGLSQGFVFPCIHNIVSRWSPLYERSRVSAFIYGGTSIGTALSMFITGAISGSQMGWPWAFYIYGGVGLLWAAVFALLASNSPSAHPRVSEDERRYIESSNSITSLTEKTPTPWKSIMLSIHVWAILVTLMGQSWGFFTLMTQIPTYMNNIMGFDMKSNSLLSALPYFVLFLTCLVTGPITDKLISGKYLSIGAARRIVTLTGTCVPAAALFSLGFTNSTQKDLVTALLVVAVAFTAFNYPGSLVNSIDLAPNHAGTLNGITNGASVITSILGPLTVGFFNHEKDDPMLWKKVFWLAAGIYAFGGIFFAVFCSGEVQKWNDLTNEKKDVESDKQETKKQKLQS